MLELWKTFGDGKAMTTQLELSRILQKYGYRLVHVTRFKNVDRVKVEAKFGFLTVNYRKHLEAYILPEVCEGLLTSEQFLKEFGKAKQ